LFEDVADFVDFVANNWTEIRTDGGDPQGLFLVVYEDQSVVPKKKQKSIII